MIQVAPPGHPARRQRDWPGSRSTIGKQRSIEQQRRDDADNCDCQAEPFTLAHGISPRSGLVLTARLILGGRCCRCALAASLWLVPLAGGAAPRLAATAASSRAAMRAIAAFFGNGAGIPTRTFLSHFVIHFLKFILELRRKNDAAELFSNCVPAE